MHWIDYQNERKAKQNKGTKPESPNLNVDANVQPAKSANWSGFLTDSFYHLAPSFFLYWHGAVFISWQHL